MPYRSVTFPITLARGIDGMILGSRMAVADIVRKHARDAVQRASEAGVDATTTGQRMVMEWMTATRASRFLRGFPATVARWCFQVEQHVVQLESEQYPAAPAMTVGGYGAGWISMMPGNVVLIAAGGIRGTGALVASAQAEGATEAAPLPVIALHEVREVRLTKSADLDGQPTYQCTVIMSNDTGQREFHEDPVEPQPVLEPEDQ